MYRVGNFDSRRDARREAKEHGAAPIRPMLDPFSLGSARKWSSEPLLNKKSAL
jgi:hypothetical protein